MPLTGSASVLSASLKAALIADPRTRAVDDTALPDEQKSLTPFCDVIAEVVIAHLLAVGAGAVITTCPAGAGTGVLA